MKKSSTEMVVGIFVLIGIVCTGYLTIKLGKIELFGDKYIDLTRGGADIILKQGDMILETEPSVDLEGLLGKYVFGGA